MIYFNQIKQLHYVAKQLHYVAIDQSTEYGLQLTDFLKMIKNKFPVYLYI